MQGPGNFLMQWMISSAQLIAQFYPIGAHLRVGQVLSGFEVFNPGKTVVHFAVAQPFFVHLPGQPFMAIEADVDEKEKPGLQAQVQQSQAPVLHVKVEMQALAQSKWGPAFWFGNCLSSYKSGRVLRTEELPPNPL